MHALQNNVWCHTNISAGLMSGNNYQTTNEENCTLNLIARTIASSCCNMDFIYRCSCQGKSQPDPGGLGFDVPAI